MDYQPDSPSIEPRLMTLRRLAAVCVVAAVTLTTASSAQTPPEQTADDAAVRLFHIGQYDEVEALLASATDIPSVVLRAQAHIARGRYAEAEQLLTAPATSAPGSDAALELGLLHAYLGRRDAASRVLQGVLARSPQNTGRDLLRAGRAARALGYFEDANAFFRGAARMAAADPHVHTAWGDLFLEKHDSAEAMVSYETALKLDASHLPAQIGMARAVLQQNPPAAQQIAEKALGINARYVPAHLLIAELALDDRRRDDARSSIRSALEVNPESLEARSLEAALAFLEGRTGDFERTVEGILAINPGYGEVYRVTGDHLGRSYLFDEAVTLTRRAIELDPANIRAHADLGMHLLRTGDETGARRALETAFEADPYDLVTFNLLANLDLVDTFTTVRERDLIVKMHPEEAPVMREFLPALAQEALDTLAAQYQFTPRTPILVEMFQQHDDFAVRTLGLPGFVGALGACFGTVVTLDSPKARPPGQFNWAATLWHEMAHVITLQMSNNRLPRWLSEGISVYEERRARDDWGREMEVSFAQALTAGRTLPLRDLNDGFTDPEMISLAYYQASLVVEHIVDTYGEPALRQFITAYGRGLETEEAMVEVFGDTIDEIQTAFDAKLQQQFADVRRALRSPELPANPTLDQLQELAQSNGESFVVQMELAQALHEAGDAPGAIAALERAAALIPQANGSQNPNALIALIATEQGDTARAIDALEALVAVDSTDIDSARRLARLLEEQQDAARAVAAHQLVAELDPFDATAQAAVGRAALERGDAGRAARSFRAALAAGRADKAAAHTDLAEALLRSGQPADARVQILAALEIAPSFERAQDLLLEILEAQPPGASR